ncbi:hypothetical protein C8Q74DRAFT_1221544 [Fomes fomentarius]|nr:hypothetical protein C8Q74DRAFT_1221544 [Fomes fomentarius]
MSADEDKQTIVDNTSSDVHFHINPQYVNVTDRITQEAFDLVKAAETTAYDQSLADITTPKWSFEHRFHGTRVTVVGVVIKYLGSGPLPAAQYAVDGDSQSISSVPNATRTLADVHFYTSDYFPLGDHVLTVNITTATSSAPYLFDYLAIDTLGPQEPISSSSSSSSSSSTSSTSSSSSLPPSSSSSSMASTTTGDSAPTTQVPVVHVGANSKGPQPMGPIIGGVVGGVALLVLCGIAFWWVYKTNRSRGLSQYAYAKTGQYDGPDDRVEAWPVAHTSASSTPGAMLGASHYSDGPAGSGSQGTQSSYAYSDPFASPSQSQSPAPFYAQPPPGSGMSRKAAEAQFVPPQAGRRSWLSMVNGGGEASLLGAPTSGPPPYVP